MTHKRTHRRGMAVVEMALLLPILLILTFGMIEYSWMFLKYQNLMNTARSAARLAATADATTGQVNSQISTMMTSYGLQDTGYTSSINPNDVGTAARGTWIVVTINLPYANAQITGMSIFPVPDSLSASCTMEKEGH